MPELKCVFAFDVFPNSWRFIWNPFAELCTKPINPFFLFQKLNYHKIKSFFEDAPLRTRREIIEAVEKQTIPDFRSIPSAVVLTLLPNTIAGRSACKRAPQWKEVRANAANAHGGEKQAGQARTERTTQRLLLFVSADNDWKYTTKAGNRLLERNGAG